MADDEATGAGPEGPSPVKADEQLWDDLLLLMEAGRVAPIVGRGLLQQGPPGQRTHIYSTLASGVARRLRVGFDPAERVADPLNTVACRHLARSHDARPIYTSICQEERCLEALPPPDALLKLASIGAFKLFVTTTFDRSLRKALDQQRFGGRQVTQRLSFRRRQFDDLPDVIDRLTRPTVYHIMGHVSPTQDDYVVTEEDALEFLHALHRNSPPLLFNELYTRDLLAIGCEFPSWFVRSFIRLTRNERLLHAREGTVFIVDSGVRADRELIEFLGAFKTRIEIFEAADPSAFVNELAARYRARVEAQPPPRVSSPLPPQGSVFLSYASDDRYFVETMKQRLEEADLDVWFDEDRIETGDDFKRRIDAAINRCDLFIPVLSRQWLTARERFFREEVEMALVKARQLPASSRFIFPVVIDDVPRRSEEILPDLRRLNWHALGGEVTETFVAAVLERYRDNQKG